VKNINPCRDDIESSEMKEVGKTASGVKCSVPGCGNQAVRSVSQAEVQAAGLSTRETRRAYLCRDHYKELKKRRRENKRIERWRYKA
jgi:hypothetical protein